MREVVVEGQRSGLWLYARDLPLQRRDMDLLNLPGDPLTVMAAAPVADVEVESWSIPEWAAQMFVGVEGPPTTRRRRQVAGGGGTGGPVAIHRRSGGHDRT
ncbi:MAG: hypothetical protein R3C12_00410 [Planctomycetaceae bacterium]